MSHRGRAKDAAAPGGTHGYHTQDICWHEYRRAGGGGSAGRGGPGQDGQGQVLDRRRHALRRDYEFDAGAYAEQLAWWKSQGADGVLVLGTNGEGPSFSVAERKKIAETAIKNRNGLDLIVTTGTPNFKETIELSQHAASIGADSLLIQPPFYYRSPRRRACWNISGW